MLDVLCGNVGLSVVNVVSFRPSPPSVPQRGLIRATAQCSLKTQRKQGYKERPCLKTRREVHGGSHCKPNTQEPKTERLPWVQDPCEPHSEALSPKTKKYNNKNSIVIKYIETRNEGILSSWSIKCAYRYFIHVCVYVYADVCVYMHTFPSSVHWNSQKPRIPLTHWAHLTTRCL